MKEAKETVALSLFLLAVKKKAINASFWLDSSVFPGASTAGAAAVCKIANPDINLSIKELEDDK